MTSNHIYKRLREWRKENMLIMKELYDGMRYIGPNDEMMNEYKWYADDCVRLKNLSKHFK